MAIWRYAFLSSSTHPRISDPLAALDLSHLRAATLTSVDGRSSFSTTADAVLIPLTVALSTPLTLFFCTTSNLWVGIQGSPTIADTCPVVKNGPSETDSSTSSIVLSQTFSVCSVTSHLAIFFRTFPRELPGPFL